MSCLIDGGNIRKRGLGTGEAAPETAVVGIIGKVFGHAKPLQAGGHGIHEIKVGVIVGLFVKETVPVYSQFLGGKAEAFPDSLIGVGEAVRSLPEVSVIRGGPAGNQHFFRVGVASAEFDEHGVIQSVAGNIKKHAQHVGSGDIQPFVQGQVLQQV